MQAFLQGSAFCRIYASTIHQEKARQTIMSRFVQNSIVLKQEFLFLVSTRIAEELGGGKRLIQKRGKLFYRQISQF